MKTFIIFLISISIVFFNLKATAQENSKAKIQNNRDNLYQYYSNNNEEKVKVLLSKIINKNNKQTLTRCELYYLLFWSKEYDSILRLAQNIKVDQYISKNKKYYKIPFYKKFGNNKKPKNDYLRYEFLGVSIEFIEDVENNLKGSIVPDEDKEFLLLLLDDLNYINFSSKISQYELNERSDIFISKFPNSKYKDFVKNIIKFETENTGLTTSVDYFGGKVSFTNDLKERYKPANLFGTGFNLSYKNFDFNLNAKLGFGKTKKDISSDAEFLPKNSSYSFAQIASSIGYNILIYEGIELKPFVGISSTDVSVSDSTAYESLDLNFSKSYLIGIAKDFLINKKKHNVNNKNYTEAHWNMYENYIFLRLKYSYNFLMFDKNHSNAVGNLHLVTLGLGVVHHKLRRKKM